MSSVVETRKTSPSKGPAPKLKTTTENEEVPADINIPDNYVAWTLKNQKPLPPITWDNLFENIQWLTLAIFTVTHSVTIYGMLTHKLRWETFVWSVIYYFITGLGELSMLERRVVRRSPVLFRYYRRLPPSLGASVL